MSEIPLGKTRQTIAEAVRKGVERHGGFEALAERFLTGAAVDLRGFAVDELPMQRALVRLIEDAWKSQIKDASGKAAWS